MFTLSTCRSCPQESLHYSGIIPALAPAPASNRACVSALTLTSQDLMDYPILSALSFIQSSLTNMNPSFSRHSRTLFLFSHSVNTMSLSGDIIPVPINGGKILQKALGTAVPVWLEVYRVPFFPLAAATSPNLRIQNSSR